MAALIAASAEAESAVAAAIRSAFSFVSRTLPLSDPLAGGPCLVRLLPASLPAPTRPPTSPPVTLDPHPVLVATHSISGFAWGRHLLESYTHPPRRRPSGRPSALSGHPSELTNSSEQSPCRQSALTARSAGHRPLPWRAPWCALHKVAEAATASDMILNRGIGLPYTCGFTDARLQQETADDSLIFCCNVVIVYFRFLT